MNTLFVRGPGLSKSLSCLYDHNRHPITGQGAWVKREDSYPSCLLWGPGRTFGRFGYLGLLDFPMPTISSGKARTPEEMKGEWLSSFVIS